MRILTLPAIALLALAGTAQARVTLTATCKDGTSWSGTRRSSACKDHQGVQAFGDATPAAAAAPAAPAAPSAAAAPATAPSVAPAAAAPAAATPAAAARTPRAQLPQTPGGGPGLVWVNVSNKVYHCQADRYYGRTKHGSYMTEAAAKTAGDRPSGGKACS